MPVRVNVHTGDSLAEPSGRPGAGRGARARSLPTASSASSTHRPSSPPALDLPAPLAPLPAAAAHVPRALSYSALALHDRCGYSYYAQRVIGLRPAARGAGDLRGALLGDAVHRAVAVGVEQACADLDAARSRRRGGLVAAWEGSSLAARMRAAGALVHELPFAFTEDDVVLRGSLDVCARAADGTLLVADLKTTALAGREPEAVVEREYALQRAIYALAALRSGAPAAEIAFCFLERPGSPVTRRYAAGDPQQLVPRPPRDHPAPSVDSGLVGVRQRLGRPCHHPRVRLLRLPRTRRRQQRHVPLGEERVRRHLDLDRPDAPRPQLPERLVDHRRDLPGVIARAACFVTCRIIPIWSWISCSIPRPWSITSDRICPVTHSTGEWQAYAVDSAAVAFSSPGPGTIAQTPSLPETRA